ncbi:MAG: Ig-like domain-containing protein [Deltaproteobacteria bacterium]|nr:Ig-like domain-containing protein [Deltaproteobacteria bacterium]
MWFLLLLLVAFVAGCAENGTEVGPKSLVSIAVTPASALIAVGGSQQYRVAATWSDQTLSDVTTSTSTVWSKIDVPAVSGEVVATLSLDGPAGGLATGTALGTSTITAQYTANGITKTASAGLTVSADVLLTIIPGASCSVASGPTIPTVTSSNPTSDNQFATTSTVGVDNSGKLITATFSLTMDPVTLISATSGALNTFTLKESVSGAIVPGTVAMDATNKVATFMASAVLIADMDYTASITADAKSATGVPISCAYELDFKTIIPA